MFCTASACEAAVLNIAKQKVYGERLGFAQAFLGITPFLCLEKLYNRADLLLVDSESVNITDAYPSS
jgi:hypothetical protein